MVDDLDAFGVVLGPDEAQPPLFVDADTVLSFSIAFERFEPVTGRNSQVIKSGGPVQLRQLSKRRAFNIHPALHPQAVEERLGVVALEALDSHGARY